MTLRPGRSARMRAASSTPVISGMAWSVSTRSRVRARRISARASRPDRASITRWPRSSSIAALFSSTRGSSSTTRTTWDVSKVWDGGTRGPATERGDGSATACAATGSQISAVVPEPGRLRSARRPCDWAASPCTIERPSPVPLPTPLVVKNGSCARARTASSMPVPVSATDRHSIVPASSGPAPSRSAPSSSPARAAIVTVPPPGIASRAFTTRLRRASSSWWASTRAGGSRSGKRVSIRISGPIERCRRSAIPRTSRARSTGSGRSSWRRAKASMRWVSAAPRSAPCTALSRRRSRRGSSGRRLRISSRLPSTAISRLLKSWATPPVSWPTASIFWAWARAPCAWARASWARRRSVMSRVTLAKPTCTPSPSRIGSMTTLAQNRVPSRRRRQPSASNLPAASAVASARAGTPCARSSSV